MRVPLRFALTFIFWTGLASLQAQENERRGADLPNPQSASNSDDEVGIYSPTRTGKSRYSWDWVLERYDRNHNGRVGRDEIPVSPEDFARLDRNWDGILTAEDFDWSADGVLCRQKETTFALFKAADTTSDGRLTRDELVAMFNKLAKDKDYLDEEDLERFIYLPRVLKTQAEYKSRATHRKFLLDDDGNLPTGPEPGALAPDFDLQSPDGATRVKLSSFRGKKPVVLIFGCLTCGNYRTYSNTLEKLYQRQKDQVEFLRVYVREAHPVDDHGPTPTNAKAGILIRQPASLEERCTVAGRCAADLHIQTPMVVDGLDNRVGQAYGGWPDRLYLIDREGRVVFQGGPGPFAFNPRELEQSLQLLLLDQEQRPSATR